MRCHFIVHLVLLNLCFPESPSLTVLGWTWRKVVLAVIWVVEEAGSQDSLKIVKLSCGDRSNEDKPVGSSRSVDSALLQIQLSCQLLTLLTNRAHHSRLITRYFPETFPSASPTQFHQDVWACLVSQVDLFMTCLISYFFLLDCPHNYRRSNSYNVSCPQFVVILLL